MRLWVIHGSRANNGERTVSIECAGDMGLGPCVWEIAKIRGISHVKHGTVIVIAIHLELIKVGIILVYKDMQFGLEVGFEKIYINPTESRCIDIGYPFQVIGLWPAIHIRYAATSVESTDADVGHRARDGEGGQRSTVIEGILSDGGECRILEEGQRGEVGAAVEGMVADSGDCIRNR